MTARSAAANRASGLGFLVQPLRTRGIQVGFYQAHMPRMRLLRSIGAVMLKRVVERS